MKKLTLFLSSIIVIVMAALLSFFLSDYNANAKELTSPILISGKSVGLNQWFPEQVLGVQTNAPKITAKAAFFIETNTGKILYSKNANEKLAIASLVKIMTVLIALEHRDLEDQFLVSERAADMEPDKMLLIAGEKLTLKELLYGIFLVSANDGAEVIAENSIKSREEFLKLMNDKALQLGMKDTYFANPTGLDEDEGSSYSTAFDLSLLSRYLIKHFPFIVDISKTDHIIFPKTINHQDYDMYSGINLLTTRPGVVGFKTGYTPQAGLTLVTLSRENGHEVLGVILGSENRRDEASQLLDYSFSQLK